MMKQGNKFNYTKLIWTIELFVIKTSVYLSICDII